MPARYTAQLVVLTEPDVKKRLVRLAKAERVSLGSIAREVLRLGLALKEGGGSNR